MKTLFAATLLALVAGCSGGSTTPTPTTPEVAKPDEHAAMTAEVKADTDAAKADTDAAKADTDAAAAADVPEGTILVETVGNEMKFNVKEIKLKAGVETTIRLVNKASAAGMDHNFVITKKGQFNTVALAAVSAGPEKDWVPESPEIVAHSKLTKPGETTEFKVTLEKGEYEFVCTFPGHYLTMNGKVIVE